MFILQAKKHEITNKDIYDLLRRPLKTVKSYNVYFVNGYMFHRDAHSKNKASVNSRLCINSVGDDVFYGKITEILEVEYPGYPIKSTMLFKYDWYDTTPDIGVKVHKQYKLVEVNKNRRYAKYEPFILAMQAEHVCYMSSPTLNNNSYWLSVFKVKPRGWTDTRPSGQNKETDFQEEAFVSNDIMATSEEDHYEYMSSDGSDNEVKRRTNTN